MRIVSLVPSATEILFALGLEDQIVGVTHECDYPEAAMEVPAVTRSVIEDVGSAEEIDAAVKQLTSQGRAIYELDEEQLCELEPDLIVTQELCAVCAVSFNDVQALVETLPSHPRVVSLDPNTLGEVLGDIRTLARETDRLDVGERLLADAACRIDRVQISVAGAERLRVAALEWLNPIYFAGHWTPQLIDYAGGEDMLGNPGEHSEMTTWEEVNAVQPEVIVVMPCGYNAARALEEAEDFREQLSLTKARKIVAVDAAAYFSRPGPRLIDGLELLAHILHPERFPEAPGAALELDLA
jgi:iron complex transport system substrate-binding protein